LPTVKLPYERFVQGLARMETSRGVRGRDPGDAAGAPIDALLAIACDEDAPGAWEELVRGHAPRLRAFLRGRGTADVEIESFLAELPGLLREAPPDGRARTRIGTYDGSGSLFSWLAVIALRTMNRRRREADARQREFTPSDVATRRDAPATPLLSEEAAQRFQAALAEAWATLTARERLAVLLRHRDGLSGREIARLMGIGEPRVSRLLEAGLARLRDAVRRRMPDTPPGTSTPDSAMWQALGEVLGRHLATLEREPHDLDERDD